MARKPVPELEDLIEGCMCGAPKLIGDDCFICGSNGDEVFYPATRSLTMRELTEYNYEGHVPDMPATEGISLCGHRVA